MLRITISGKELFDEVNNEFIYTKSQKLILEHSLMSISEWEATYHKPFLTKDPKTGQEIRDYIRFMTINKDVDPSVYDRLSSKEIDKIQAYIDDKRTATWFSQNDNNKMSRQIITSEIIYYWMICNGIPFECQKWHINRLLTLIQVCQRMNNPKKMSQKEVYKANKELNEARKKQYNTTG